MSVAPFHLRRAISIDSLFDRHLIRSASGAYGILARRGDRRGDRTGIVSPGAVLPSPSHQW
ncbi:hypothetical protein QUB70_27435 [Microcoleus sp. A003_D6]|uniref:hypothetical protein n=1 Tax=Microcoleus sp. A003_D6 TaxID=3055266 RepID=UPI002FD31555